MFGFDPIDFLSFFLDFRYPSIFHTANLVFKRWWMRLLQLILHIFVPILFGGDLDNR
jgi:hypothetical protein